MKRCYGRWTAIGCLVSGLAMAAPGETNVQDIVVSATRIATPLQEVASSVTVIDRQILEGHQSETVADVLRTAIPGLDINQAGGPAGSGSVYLRGSKTEHVLVLLDGVEINDPITPGRAFEWALLSVADIEQIEVLRGPQSTLYGSDAIGGVINIVTRKGSGEPQVTLMAEGGSYGSFTESADVRGGTDKVNYSAGIRHFETDGISAADEDAGNTEKDGYENTTLSSQLGWTPTSDHSLDLMVRYTDVSMEYDDFYSGVPVDANSVGDTKNLLARAQFGLKTFDEQWNQKIGFSWVDYDRNDDTEISKSVFNSQSHQIDWQNDLTWVDWNTLTFGADYQEESGESTYESDLWTETFNQKSARMTGVYLQDVIKPVPAFQTALGVRFDDHNQAGSEVTYRVAPLVTLAGSGTRLKGSVGTGFKAPSLFQLYSIYGSRQLEPETSLGWDAGVEQDLVDGRMTLGVTYFENSWKNMIDYDYATFSYANIAEASARGVENFVVFRPTQHLDVRTAYTYTDTKNETTGESLLRRPRNKAGVDVTYSGIPSLRLTAGLQYVGVRKDQDFATWPASQVNLDDYTLLNLAAAYDLTKHWEIFGRVNNVFDTEYQEVLGYGTMGLAAYGGVRTTF
jgi:vitamin B12 transporter